MDLSRPYSQRTPCPRGQATLCCVDHCDVKHSWPFGLGVKEMKRIFKPGDPVIFRVTKQSTDPGPRAVDVHPAPAGDTYSYQVDKYWTVGEVHADNTVQLVTRRGKQRIVAMDDLRLRHARWWERWFYADRFPKLSQLNNLTSSSSAD